MGKIPRETRTAQLGRKQFVPTAARVWVRLPRLSSAAVCIYIYVYLYTNIRICVRVYIYQYVAYVSFLSRCICIEMCGCVCIYSYGSVCVNI